MRNIDWKEVSITVLRGSLVTIKWTAEMTTVLLKKLINLCRRGIEYLDRKKAPVVAGGSGEAVKEQDSRVTPLTKPELGGENNCYESRVAKAISDMDKVMYHRPKAPPELYNEGSIPPLR